MLCHVTENTYILIRNLSGDIAIAPMFRYSIPLLAPHHLLEAEKFNIRYTDPAQITCMADKLRWYRYKKALLQREVAALAGIERSIYLHYEDPARDNYSLNVMERIALILGVPVTELLDEYHLFLYND